MKAHTRSILDRLFGAHPELEALRRPFEQAFAALHGCLARDGKVLVCGNGGSAADSEHIVGELMKGFRSRRPVPASHRERLTRLFPIEGPGLAERLQGALPALSLVSQVSLCTAIGNDVSSDMVFAQQVYGYGRAGDVLIGISTSGNAANVLNAVRVAKAFGLHSIAFTGRGGALGELADTVLAVPGEDTSVIQEHHMQLYHALCAMLEAESFG
jgi:phosphoheptose isomerase